MDKFKFMGIVFDDVVVEDGGTRLQMCPRCVERFRVADNYLDDVGSGICGVDIGFGGV